MHIELYCTLPIVTVVAGAAIVVELDTVVSETAARDVVSVNIVVDVEVSGVEGNTVTVPAIDVLLVVVGFGDDVLGDVFIDVV